MVDISDKTDTVRTAVAVGRVILGPEAFSQVSENTIQKGDVLAVSQFAGIMGAKETSRLIPLCHQVALAGIDVELTLDESNHSVEVRAYTKSIGPTGVEMEALTAVQITLLTIYDMCKAMDRGMTMSNIGLLKKSGGKSGEWNK